MQYFWCHGSVFCFSAVCRLFLTIHAEVEFHETPSQQTHSARGVSIYVQTLEVGHLTRQMEHFVVLLMQNTF